MPELHPLAQNFAPAAADARVGHSQLVRGDVVGENTGGADKRVGSELLPGAAALFPAQGWDIQMMEDSHQRFAFTISRCFYLDVLKAYGAPELTAHFCQLDDIAYAALPPQVRWERTTTLGRGGPNCDFCWRAGTRAAG